MYKRLPYTTLTPGAALYKPDLPLPGHVTMDDPATYVMTDLHNATAFTILAAASIDAANDKMIACGVRSLFVTDSDGPILGLITASDILGEKPVMFLKEHGGTRDRIQVQDIMTPRDTLEALRISDIEKAKVGDIVESMKMFGRQHVLVVEKNPKGSAESVRGIISTTQIGRQLGIEIKPSNEVNTILSLMKFEEPAA